MAINFPEILERERQRMAYGIQPPFEHHVPKSEIDAMVKEYEGTPMETIMRQQIASLGGVMFSNTVVKGSANPQ